MRQLIRRVLNPTFTDTMEGLERQFKRQDRKQAVLGVVVTSPEEVAEVLALNFDPNEPTADSVGPSRKTIFIVAGTALYVYVYAAGILYV